MFTKISKNVYRLNTRYLKCSRPEVFHISVFRIFGIPVYVNDISWGGVGANLNMKIIYVLFTTYIPSLKIILCNIFSDLYFFF